MVDPLLFDDPDFPVKVETNESEITIWWDENHPVTSVFNTWTSEDFMECIMASARRVIDEIEKV